MSVTILFNSKIKVVRGSNLGQVGTPVPITKADDITRQKPKPTAVGEWKIYEWGWWSKA